MSFNIKKILQKKKLIQQKKDSIRILIESVLQEKDLDFSYKIQGDILLLMNISPILRTQIKLKKQSIISLLREKKIFLRDII